MDEKLTCALTQLVQQAGVLSFCQWCVWRLETRENVQMINFNYNNTKNRKAWKHTLNVMETEEILGKTGQLKQIEDEEDGRWKVKQIVDMKPVMECGG